MSSSNPFRRAAPPITTDNAESTVEAIVPLQSKQHPSAQLEPPAKRVTGTKKVRITSPPHSPPHPSSPAENNWSEFRTKKSHHDAPSTPFASSFPKMEDEDGENDDSSERASSSEDVERSTDTEKMSESMAATTILSGAPPNPFSRTLATMEDPLKSALVKGQKLEDTERRPSDKDLPRASMDVDSFKNLLMTGKPTPNSTLFLGSQPKAQSYTLADNSSSTDTSSISRQSLFEPVHDMHLETPRTSNEISVSDEEDNTSSVPERRKSTKTKPPPPRHKHGKAVAPKGPQIVSFSDFTPSFSSPGGQRLPITVTGSSPPDSPMPLERRSSDMSRPLPPPPRRPSSRDSASVDKDLMSPRRSSEYPLSDISEPNSPQRRVPPPPPLARRSSQLYTNNPVISGRSRSSTQASTTSQQDENTRSYPGSIAESTASSTQKAPPPPPPARRSGAHPGARHLDNSSLNNEESSPLSLSRASSLKSPPPPPARNRSLSQLSSPASSASGMMSPPPRPPPRRTSSRSSLDAQTSPPGSRRTSAEIGRSSVDAERRPSMSSIMRGTPIREEPMQDEEYPLSRHTYPLGNEKSGISPKSMAEDVLSAPSKDVLAEMEAFQKEIDELRERFGPMG